MILLIRLDRIGDLVSTLPVDEHPALKGQPMMWFISKGLGFIPKNAVPERRFQEWPTKITFGEFFKFVKSIRTLKPKVAIAFHAPWWVSLALVLAGVPQRVGPASQWHHFIFLNRTLKQKRSDSIRHEADYNFELMNFAFYNASGGAPVLKLRVPDVKVETPTLPFIVVHAGMSGSALNWPQSQYNQLIENILKRGLHVVFTGTESDLPYWDQILPKWQSNASVKNLIGKLNQIELLKVLSKSKGVVAPSTGVVHLAASLGVPVIGMYPPVRVQSPVRWKPRGPHAQAFKPKVNCPGHFVCLRNDCRLYNCMDEISVNQVMVALGI